MLYYNKDKPLTGRFWQTSGGVWKAINLEGTQRTCRLQVEAMRFSETGKAPIIKEERCLHDIAREIGTSWLDKNGNSAISPYAAPYVDAMASLDTIEDKYHLDSGQEIVARFLSNANSWKGDTARRVKKELNSMLKASYR